MKKILFCALAALLAVYTQTTHLTSVPGLHFDEAWQGLFAQRIATETGFHPLSAMNSYTSPLVHYWLACVFQLFGPSLEAMRGAYAAMNLLTMALIALLLWRTGERLAVTWFMLLWALLPLSVHIHRFYVEVTGFHGFCLALALWGFYLWKRRPALSFALIFLATVAGTYSHILFISVFVSAIFAAARSFPAEFRSRRSQALIAVTAIALLPLPIRMGLGLHKVSPFALAAALAATAAWAVAAPRWIRFQRSWVRWPRRAMRLARVFFFVSVPFMVGFVALMWNGFWPYAQATGHLNLLWLPINALIFILFAYLQTRRRPPGRHAQPQAAAPVFDERRGVYMLSPGLVWGAFVMTFLVTSVLILKQTPRYYTVPATLAMIWAAQRMARLRNDQLRITLTFLFVGWNLWAFERDYLHRFETEGSNTNEFRVAIFHDNGRDFRPFQKLVEWGLKTNCLAPQPWVEDDRFGLPFQFLRLTAPAPAQVACPYYPGDLFYSHIPNYDPSFTGERTDRNTPPPVENVKFLAHFRDWGDLAVWIKR